MRKMNGMLAKSLVTENYYFFVTYLRISFLLSQQLNWITTKASFSSSPYTFTQKKTVQLRKFKVSDLYCDSVLLLKDWTQPCQGSLEVDDKMVTSRYGF